MKNLLKKSLLVGMGAISLTKEKAEKMVRELEEKGDIKTHEAKDFVDELVEKGEQERILLRDAIKRELNEVQASMNLPTKSDLAALEERIKRIEEKLGMVQPAAGSGNSAADFPSGE